MVERAFVFAEGPRICAAPQTRMHVKKSARIQKISSGRPIWSDRYFKWRVTVRAASLHPARQID